MEIVTKPMPAKCNWFICKSVCKRIVGSPVPALHPLEGPPVSKIVQKAFLAMNCCWPYKSIAWSIQCIWLMVVMYCCRCCGLTNSIHTNTCTYKRTTHRWLLFAHLHRNCVPPKQAHNTAISCNEIVEMKIGKCLWWKDRKQL